MNFLGNRENLLHNAFSIRELMRLDVGRVNRGGIDGADTLDGGIEVIEGIFLNECRNLSGNPTEGLRFINKAGLIRLLHGLDDGILIERADRAEIDDLSADSVLKLKDFSSFETA